MWQKPPTKALRPEKTVNGDPTLHGKVWLRTSGCGEDVRHSTSPAYPLNTTGCRYKILAVSLAEIAVSSRSQQYFFTSTFDVQSYIQRHPSIMALGGAALRITQAALRVIQLLCGVVALAIFSYFLAVLSDHKLPIHTWIRAVEGMSGASVLYLLFAILLTIFLGGKILIGFILVVLDLCFVGCYAAVAYYTRGGAGSCQGNVDTVLGSGPSDSSAPGYGANGFGFGGNHNVTYAPNLGRACKLETVVFAVAIINIFLFLVTAALQVLLVRHHKKEKRYGPSPANNYTSGVGRTPFWRRNKKIHSTRDAEMATAGTGAIRPSHETGYTGTTMNGPTAMAESKYGQEGYGDTFAHNTTTAATGPYTTTAHSGYGNDHRVPATNY
jgi:hypothetical protein